LEKLWGGRFQKQTHQLVDAFTSSIAFDQELALVDIAGSRAHVNMLAAAGIISDEDRTILRDGLDQLAAKAAAGEIAWDTSHEDIHMNVEYHLTKLVGPVGGRLHTARSRNDQVALDMHLYTREAVDMVMEKIRVVQKALVAVAENHIDTVLPGYTHLQRAQPVSLAHHLLAYAWMLQRDWERFRDGRARVNICPLGAGALAGTTFPIDRRHTAAELGFDDVYANSMDAVSDRDFVIEFLAAASILIMHMSRLSEELVLWSSEEFHFIELDDAFCTGSSIMPQKKNPDVAELLRGKTGRVYGHLLAVLTVLKGLPMTYNKDMQEDKEGLFDTVKTLSGALDLLAPMLETMRVNGQAMEKAVAEDYACAVDLADYLVRQGMPFREAHGIVGRLVFHCIKEGCYLHQLPLSTYQEHSELFGEDLYQCIEPKAAVQNRVSEGSTGREALRQQLDRLKEKMG